MIERHDGRVMRFMGDGVLAVFGVPSVREDDAERAVRAGLAECTTASVVGLLDAFSVGPAPFCIEAF